MGLLTIYLRNMCVTDIDNSDIEWVQYVTDHYRELQASAVTVEVLPTDMELYRFRLSDWLSDRGYAKRLAWIVMLLNNIKSDREFVGFQQLRIPDSSQISQLRAQFNTFIAAKKQLA